MSRSDPALWGLNLLSPVRPFVPPFVFAVLFLLSLNFSSDSFYASLNLVVSLTKTKFDKFRCYQLRLQQSVLLVLCNMAKILNLNLSRFAMVTTLSPFSSIKLAVCSRQTCLHLDACATQAGELNILTSFSRCVVGK